MSYSSVTVALTCSALIAGASETSDLDVKDGRLAYNNHCRTCHSLKEGDNRLGPSLHDIFGATAGTAQGYGNYSQSLVSSGVVWDEKTLDAFIAAPDKVIPGNNMKPYAGISAAEIREKIVAYLISETENPD